MIVFTDIDGTLYDYHGIMPESTKEAVRKLKENGHRIYMVTGRSKAENKDELWDMNFNGIICANGAYIEDEGKIVYHKSLSYEQCKHIVDWCDSRGLSFYEESNNGLFPSKNFYKDAGKAINIYRYGTADGYKDLSEEEVNRIFHGMVKTDDLYREDVNKISFILHSYEDYLDAVEEFPELKVGTWGGKGESAIFGDISIYTDKAEAIAVLLNYLNEDVKNTFAIGDSETDIPMIKCCGTGIAVNSGREEIKAVADHVTDDVDKDGFYKAMKHYDLI